MKGIDKMGIKSSLENKKGFTIIEVVLVLAIAGLIFLMVFIALPGMQKSQRDTQRRDDYAALSTSVTNYMTNNNGSLPVKDNACKSGFTNKQINTSGEDPNHLSYDLQCASNVQAAQGMVKGAVEKDTPTKVVVVQQATCAEGELQPTNSRRAFAIYGQLEDGTYCNSSN